MKVYYDSELIYMQSATTLLAKINAIDDIIDGLIIAAATAATTGNIEEYSLNDGQTTIRTTYRSVSAIESAITGFEKMRHRYLSRLNKSRIARAVDSKNIRYGY